MRESIICQSTVYRNGNKSLLIVPKIIHAVKVGAVPNVQPSGYPKIWIKQKRTPSTKMGNTTSWGSDLLGSACGYVLPVSGEPPPIVPDNEEVPVHLYRTRKSKTSGKQYMCKHIKRKRSCRYGSACKFAHSKYELLVPESEFYRRKRVHLRPV